MDYLIGKADTNVVEDIISDTCFDFQKDTLTFYSNNIEEVRAAFENSVNMPRITIRGYFDKIISDDLAFCKKNKIKLSLIIKKLSQKIKSIITVLTDNEINFECIIPDYLIENCEAKNYFLDLIIKNKYVRIMQKSSSNIVFFNSIRSFQEELFVRGSNQFLNILDNELLCNEIECRILCINKQIFELFQDALPQNFESCDCTFIIDQHKTPFYLLESIDCYSPKGISYLRNVANKKLQSRLMSNHSNKTTMIEDFDIVFIYANRFRSTVSVPFPPVGLYYLNTLVQSSGFKSKVIECTENSFLKEFQSIIDKTKVVGFYCACNNEILVTNMISYIKENSDIKVIVGGPQTPAFDEKFFLRSKADVAVVGEGEGAIIDLLNYYIYNIGDFEKIGNIKYLNKDVLYCVPQRDIIANLDDYPFAKIKRSEIIKYNSPNRIFVLTGRGCPNRCTFCYEGANARKVRYRSMKCVFDEINYLLNEFPTAGLIHVLDDTFTCDQKRVYEFCDNMRKVREYRKIEWVCEVHINTVWNKPELIKYMIDSGMRGFQIGLESGSDKVLKAYKKNTTAEMIKRFIDCCSELKQDLFIEGNIILGGPFESVDTINESLEICKYLISKGKGIVELNTLCFSPLPNTDITKHPENYGLRIHWDEVESSILSMSSVVTSSAYLSKEEIENEKIRIDEEIQNQYIYEALRLSPKQVMKYWNKSIRQFMIGSRWGAVLNQYEHFINYALSKTFDNPIHVEYSPDVFPVRTFEKMEYLDRNFRRYEICFSDIEKRILKMSTGKYNVLDICINLNVSFEELQITFESLANRCLIYYSLF